MPITYETKNNPNDDVHATMLAAMRDHCPELVGIGARIDTIVARNIDEKTGVLTQAVKLGGYPCAAVVKPNNLKQRAQGMGDALITVDAATWGELTEAEKVALMHHELYHLEPVGLQKSHDGQGFVCETDDLSRPRFTSRKHDWQHGGFRHIAEVHGENAIEVSEAHKITRRFGDVLNPEPAGTDAPAPKNYRIEVGGGSVAVSET